MNNTLKLVGKIGVGIVGYVLGRKVIIKSADYAGQAIIDYMDNKTKKRAEELAKEQEELIKEHEETKEDNKTEAI
jgi:Skp family chaperone for outer membrane proteins